MLNTKSIVASPERNGLAEATLYRYLEDKDSRKQYRQARTSLVENASSQIQSATGEAVETLRRNLDCGNAALELETAQIIIEIAVKGELVDILDRLQRLETKDG